MVGAASLLLGAIVSMRFEVRARIVGLVMAFGAGTLISAVAFDLTLVAYREGGRASILFGMVGGTAALYGLEWLLARYTVEEEIREHTTTVSGPSLVLGALLDGIPESIAIGITLLGGSSVSVAMVTAVFLSNIPEGLSASVGLAQAGWTKGRVIGVWLVVIAVCVVATMVGYQLLGGATGSTLAFIQAFAAGTILTLLANTMMPEAFANGGKRVGLLTVAGFILASVLATYGG